MLCGCEGVFDEISQNTFIDIFFFTAGDHVKFNFPQAWAITTLAMGGIDFKNGYVSAGQFDYLLDAVKWGADYYLKVFQQIEYFDGLSQFSIYPSVTQAKQNCTFRSVIPQQIIIGGIYQNGGLILVQLTK